MQKQRLELDELKENVTVVRDEIREQVQKYSNCVWGHVYCCNAGQSGGGNMLYCRSIYDHSYDKFDEYFSVHVLLIFYNQFHCNLLCSTWH